MTKPTVKGGLAPANAVWVKGRGAESESPRPARAFTGLKRPSSESSVFGGTLTPRKALPRWYIASAHGEQAVDRLAGRFQDEVLASCG